MYPVQHGSRSIFIIKDLSEVEKGIAKTTLARISKDLAEGNKERLYLIAANHGQLYEQWLPLLELPAARATWPCIEDQLVDGATHSPIGLRVFNLSARPAADSMRAVMNQVLEHPTWAQCAGCERADQQQPCPISENRARLREGTVGAVFRDRLLKLMELSTQNNQHIPVRQQLMLVANIILGHRMGEQRNRRYSRYRLTRRRGASGRRPNARGCSAGAIGHRNARGATASGLCKPLVSQDIRTQGNWCTLRGAEPYAALETVNVWRRPRKRTAGRHLANAIVCGVRRSVRHFACSRRRGARTDRQAP